MEITTAHKTNKKKVENIKKEMEILGVPVIRIAETAYGFIAIEGCHRVEAAHQLDLCPKLEIVDHDLAITDHGLQDFEDEVMTIEQILEYIDVPSGKTYDFEV